AYRLKGVRGDSWRIFRVEVGKIPGRLGMLCRRIPPLPLTRNGKPFLDWQAGMPLHMFISLVCRTSSTEGYTSLEKRARSIEIDASRDEELIKNRITDMAKS
ncbi:MAG: hypothetical protein NZ737_02585, partial [Candidatus Poseidoniaceae archaeon]|nr:hypothetical protein [Candidatus Poseidoniaceae archaeon]